MPTKSLPAHTLSHVLAQSARLYGHNPSLVDIGGSPISFIELEHSARDLSQWLIEQGIGFGDKVAILSENCAHWGIAYFAVTTMGAIAVPILTEFHNDAIAHIVRQSEAKAVFVSEKMYPKISDAEFEQPPLFINLETFTLLEQGIGRDRLRELKSAGLREYRKWQEKAMRLAKKVVPAGPKAPGEDDIAVIIYTSGTSGHSKGVMLSHKNLVFDAAVVDTVVHVGVGDRMLSILPLPHTYECTLGLILPVLMGCSVHYMDKPPTARVLMPVLQQIKPTVMLTVPLVVEKIYKTNLLPRFTANRLMRLLYSVPFIRRRMHKKAGAKMMEFFGGQIKIIPFGGAPLAADVERFMKEAAFPYAVGYGLTECSPLVSGSSITETRLYSAGRPLKGIAARIDSTNPETGEGEIQVYGPNVMQGYFKDPVNTAEAFTEDGWLRTGDLGYIDEDGYIYIKGRLKNLILGPSGENIYPEEIESFFFASPFVLEALVYQEQGRVAARVHFDAGKIDEVYGGLPESEVVAKKEELLEAIRQEVNTKVSNFARVIKITEQREPFEKTPTQKIKRYLYI